MKNMLNHAETQSFQRLSQHTCKGLMCSLLSKSAQRDRVFFQLYSGLLTLFGQLFKNKTFKKYISVVVSKYL
jgi:hypothetical protein